MHRCYRWMRGGSDVVLCPSQRGQNNKDTNHNEAFP